ncbi:MAG TPA: hypothetical protein PK706_26565, partial [Xanthobacteraceae bacterium]|nr:hypothetical protein [Xanthobacteraceae bacterium]
IIEFFDNLFYDILKILSLFKYARRRSAMQIEQSAARGVLWQERRWDVVHRGLDQLLAMAQRYQNEGRTCQAADIYWMLSEEHTGTAQAIASEEGLLRLAEAYDRNGSRHMARAIFERLSSLT